MKYYLLRVSKLKNKLFEYYTDFSFILQQYVYGIGWFREYHNQCIQEKDITDFLKKHTTNSELTFSLKKRTILNIIEIPYFMDSQYGVVLKKENYPVAIFAFSVKKDRGIIVNQIQGINIEHTNVHDYKLPKKWEKNGLSAIVDWCVSENFNYVGVVPGNKLSSYKFNVGEIDPVILKSNLMLRMNGTAKKCQFKYNEERGIYFKKL